MTNKKERIRETTSGNQTEGCQGQVQSRAEIQSSGEGKNDDIGEETRLALWRSLLEIRHVEQRAYDLFLQNLIKGTVSL